MFDIDGPALESERHDEMHHDEPWDEEDSEEDSDRLGRQLELAKNRANAYSNRLSIAELRSNPRGGHEGGREGDDSSENSGTTNNTNCAVANTFPYMLATSRDDEPNSRLLKLQREITTLRTENMVIIARNLALDQKLASYAGELENESKTEGGSSAQDVLQVDEDFVKTCKDQLIEANLRAQESRCESEALKEKLEGCEEECDALARLVQALSRKIVALDSASANEDEHQGEGDGERESERESSKASKEGAASLLSGTSIAALASDTGLSIIKHLVKGDKHSLKRGSPLGSPKEKKKQGRLSLMTANTGLTMGLKGVVGSVLGEPPVPPPSGASSPKHTQARKSSNDAGNTGSPVASGKSRPRSAVSPDAPKTKRAAKAKASARSASSTGAGAGTGTGASSSSAGRAGAKARLKAAVPSFRDDSGVRRSIKIVVPSGKQTNNAGASQPLRRRAGPPSGGGGGGSSSSAGSNGGGRGAAAATLTAKGSSLSQMKRAVIRPASAPAATLALAAAAEMESDDDTGSREAGFPGRALDESALGNLSLDSEGPEYSVFADALEAVAKEESERAASGLSEAAGGMGAKAAGMGMDMGRSRIAVKPAVPRREGPKRGTAKRSKQ